MPQRFSKPATNTFSPSGFQCSADTSSPRHIGVISNFVGVDALVVILSRRILECNDKIIAPGKEIPTALGEIAASTQIKEDDKDKCR